MTVYNQLSDQELTALLKDGNQSAFEEIYNRYWGVLFRYSRRLLQNDVEAGDVIQDIFVMLWTKSNELELRGSLSSFLYASVRNRILKIFSKNKVHANYLSSFESFLDKGEFVTDNQLREWELAARIEYEVALLPAKMREVFELSRKANLSYKQIAEKLDIAETTVKKQVNNALKILRLKLGSLLPVALLLL